MAVTRSPEMRLVAYALARLGEKVDGGPSLPPTWLRERRWKDAYDLFYQRLGDGRTRESFARSFKNARDAFDAYVESGRIGWRRPDHSVPPRGGAIGALLDVWEPRSDQELKDAVLTILDRLPGRQAEQGAGSGPLQLVTDLAAVTQVWNRWTNTLIAKAEALSETRWWNTGVNLHIRRHHQSGMIALSRDPAGERWTVELSPLSRPGNANLLTGIGRGADGGLWLLRQGWLHPNDGSGIHIKGEDFRIGTGLAPVSVDVGNGPQDREWYVVCQLDGSEADIVAATTLFVARCDLARGQSGSDPLAKAALIGVQALLAGDEVMGFLRRKATPAADERLIWKKHAEVSAALKAELALAGLRLDKVRPAPGFEVDGVIPVSPRPVLVEIKTAFSAANVYTAVGQLMLYRRMLCSDGSHHLALVLPRAPSAPLSIALSALGFLVCVYRRMKNEAGSESIIFDDTLRRLYAPGAEALSL